MPIADKYRLHRQVGWSDAAEVHAGPLDPTHGVPVAVKLRHGMGGVPRPEGNRARFLRAANEQAAAVLAGCKGVAPIFEVGQESSDAFYVTKHYPRSLDSLIQGRVSLDADALHRLTDGVLKALEELRDKQSRTHGNLKPTNIFLDGKNVGNASVVLSDLGLQDESNNQAADCYAFGATLYQLLRGRTVRNFDWPMENTPDWQKLGPLADAWRRFCNVLMSPDLGMDSHPLAGVRQAFKKMKSLAHAAPSLSGVGIPGGSDTRGTGAATRPGPGGHKGLLTGVAAAVAAAVGGTVLYFHQANQKVSDRLNRVPGAVSTLTTLTPALGELARNVSSLPGARRSASPAPGSSPASGEVADGGRAATASPDTPPVATPMVAEATPDLTPPPTPTPVAAIELNRWTGYSTRLEQLKATLSDPAAQEQPETLNVALLSFKETAGSLLPVSGEVSVGDFLRKLPPKLEATGDIADLPPNLWTKRSAARQDEISTVTYEWGKSGFQMQFNRVALPNGGAFYLSATTVPVSFGLALAQLAGPANALQGGNGPVAWEKTAAGYQRRAEWMKQDTFNPFYGMATGSPTSDSPMNGLSGMNALKLAQAAGGALPTLAQWKATLNSPAGQEWTARWRSFAKVRSPEWAAFAKKAQEQARLTTGTLLPNRGCFGDALDLSAVGTSSDPSIFFEPVNKRVLKSFAHLIGNVGQYVVDDARNPATYYFAGGSAESAPSVLQNLTEPPVVRSPYAVAADASFRLAVAAKGNGSDKNQALDRLKHDVDVELARVQKLL